MARASTDDEEVETPFPTLDHRGPPTFSSHLSPDDAYMSPPRRAYTGDSATESTRPRLRHLNSDHGSRRRKKAWKKLMWVKQSCTHTSNPNTRVVLTI
jgi:phosphatidylinositol N-acetylglucosaminyltransferase subunit C